MNRNYNYFDLKLAYYAAPSLLGIKSASLISLCPNEFGIISQAEYFNKRVTGLRLQLLNQSSSNALMLLYNKKLLAQSLSQIDRRIILESYGYGCFLSIDNDLKLLSLRIAFSKEFPHEIGVFLGYPTEDIIGFIECNGKNYKLCGCWKVYGNVERARQAFITYNKCRDFLFNKLIEGNTIYDILNSIRGGYTIETDSNLLEQHRKYTTNG